MVLLALQISFDGYHIFLGDHMFQEKTTVEVDPRREVGRERRGILVP